jgi:hypothetical protein
VDAAVKRYSSTTFQFLLNRLPQQVTALMVCLATERDGCSLVAVLQTNKFDVNSRDISGRTALHNSAEHGYESIIQMLLEYGANPHLHDENGQTPLMLAVKQGHQGIASLLEDHIKQNHWITSDATTSWCRYCLKRYLHGKGHRFCSSCGQDLPAGSTYYFSDRRDGFGRFWGCDWLFQDRWNEGSTGCPKPFSSPVPLKCSSCIHELLEHVSYATVTHDSKTGFRRVNPSNNRYPSEPRESNSWRT